MIQKFFIGREWNFELLLGSPDRTWPTQITLRVSGSIDPDSGMIANLKDIDKIWEDARPLTKKRWTQAEDFLEAFHQQALKACEHLTVVLESSSLQNLGSDPMAEFLDAVGYEASHLYFQSLVTFFEKTEKGPRPRQAQIRSSQKEFLPDAIRWLKKQESLALENPPKGVFQIQVKDAFSRFFEFEKTFDSIE